MEDLRLRRLKFRDLHILDTVAEAGSMAKAAPRLGMSQPAVSRVVADMEHLLGVPLFDRTSTGVELTRFGRALRRRTITVTDELKQGLGELTSLADPDAGRNSYRDDRTHDGADRHDHPEYFGGVSEDQLCHQRGRYAGAARKVASTRDRHRRDPNGGRFRPLRGSCRRGAVRGRTRRDRGQDTIRSYAAGTSRSGA